MYVLPQKEHSLNADKMCLPGLWQTAITTPQSCIHYTTYTTFSHLVKLHHTVVSWQLGMHFT